MKIGDKVTSKQTGLPGVGTVCAIESGKFHSTINRHPTERWDWTYPDWRDKNVITVHYDELRYVQSYDEFSNFTPFKSAPDQERKILYKYSQKAYFIRYPIDDLEIFERTEQHVN